MTTGFLAAGRRARGDRFGASKTFEEARFSGGFRALVLEGVVLASAGLSVFFFGAGTPAALELAAGFAVPAGFVKSLASGASMLGIGGIFGSGVGAGAGC